MPCWENATTVKGVGSHRKKKTGEGRQRGWGGRKRNVGKGKGSWGTGLIERGGWEKDINSTCLVMIGRRVP